MKKDLNSQKQLKIGACFYASLDLVESGEIAFREVLVRCTNAEVFTKVHKIVRNNADVVATGTALCDKLICNLRKIFKVIKDPLNTYRSDPEVLFYILFCNTLAITNDN